MAEYPLELVNIGGDRYALASKGHHDPDAFMRQAAREYPHFFPLRTPSHDYCKITPLPAGCRWNDVREGTRGSFPVTWTSETSWSDCPVPRMSWAELRAWGAEVTPS